MKATEIITEIERLSARDYEGGADEMHTGPSSKKVYKPLPGPSGLHYAIVKGGNYGMTIYIADFQADHAGAQEVFKPSKKYSWEFARDYERRIKGDKKDFEAGREKTIAGQLNLYKKDKPFKGAWAVSTITTHEKYRGLGIAKALYGIALSILKVPLVSGDSQTPGGRKNWVSLANIPGVEVKGFVSVDFEDLTTRKAVKSDRAWYAKHVQQQNKQAELIIDSLMNLGGQYLGGQLKAGGTTYWAFDVVPGNGELVPAVKSMLSTLYTNGYNHSGAMLYAIWTGK